MSEKMTGQDVKEAAMALFDWFGSQELGPPESVLVMVWAIATILDAAAPNEKEKKHGGELVFNMLMEALEA